MPLLLQCHLTAPRLLDRAFEVTVDKQVIGWYLGVIVAKGRFVTRHKVTRHK